MAKEKNLEFKVGLFVLAALISLTFFIFSITDSVMFEEGKTIRVIYNFANGLKKSAPVRVAGVDGGVVRDIRLFFDKNDGRTKAAVEIWINKVTIIPKDSVFTINQLGLLGEKYIEIIPGIDTKNYYEDGSVVIGSDPIAQEQISAQVVEIASKIEKTIEGINVIFTDEESLTSISTMLKNFADSSGSIKQILSSIESGKGTVGKFLYDESFYDDLQGLSADLKANPWKLLYRPKGKR